MKLKKKKWGHHFSHNRGYIVYHRIKVMKKNLRLHIIYIITPTRIYKSNQRALNSHIRYNLSNSEENKSKIEVISTTKG